MVSHVIIWKLDETCDAEKVKREAKENLEALVGKIEGLISLKVETEALSSSSGDMLLDSLFENAEALSAYAVDPLHVKAADTYVRPFAKVRLSFDLLSLEKKVGKETFNLGECKDDLCCS